MLSKNIKILFNEGLHARPATELIKLIQPYNSEVKLSKGDTTVDAKSILGIMSLGVSKDDEISIEISGDDEKDVMDALDKFFATEEG